MQKKMLLTLSVVGSVLCNQEAVKTAFAQESGPSALLERSSTKTATTTENLNLRDKASTGGKILTTIPKGKAVTLLSERDANGWYKVSYGGKTGYVSGDYLNTQTNSSTTTTTKTGIATENLNLRDKASTSGKILTTIPKGKTLQVLSEKDANGWYKVSYGGKTGYSIGSYIKVNETTNTPSTTVTKSGTTTENLNLRDQASTSGKVLTTIPKGKTLQVLSEKDANGWYKVSYGGKIGYANSSYITISSNSTTTTPSMPPLTETKSGTTIENLNLRDQASTSGKILMTIPKGKTVEILSEKDANGWYKVSYDGKTGYASSSYIVTNSNSATTTPSTPPTITVNKKGITTENLNLRNQADLSGKILTTIPKGKTIQILSEKDANGWYKVSYNGKTGYAISNYIKEITDDSDSDSSTSAPSNQIPIEGQTTENLNLRDQASTLGKILLTIPKGKTAQILEDKDANGWYKVNYAGNIGYVIGDYFKVTKYQELEEVVIWMGTVNTNDSLVYQTANASSSILTTYQSGQKVEVVKVEGDWIRIKYQDTYAWMLKEYVTEGNLPEVTVLWDGKTIQDTKMYSKPNTSSTILNSLVKDSVVYVIEENGDWLKVKNEGGYGYVPRSMIINQNLPTTPETPEEPETVLWTGKTISDLNVRTQPSINGMILGTLLSGTTVEVFSEEENGWLKIKYEDNYGYVNGHYVKKDEETTPETPNVPEIDKQIAYVYNLGAEKLNVRPQPNTAHAPIGTLVEGDMVTIVGEIGNWYEIEYNNSIAYVSKDYITFEKPSETPDVDKQIAYVYNLGAGTLNVRPQPNTTQAPIGILVEGDTVTIIGEIGNWYKIEYENSIAYVSKNYITFEKPSQHPDSNIDFEVEPHTGIVIDDVPTLNVREQATTNSKIIGTLTEQDEVTIIGIENNFYRINYNNGIGYVHKDYIGVKATSDLNGRVSYLTTQYNYSLTHFAQIQQNYTSGTINSITSYLDPSNRSNISYLLQYLRIDKFRSFNVYGLNQQLLNKGVLHNQAQTFYNAAKYYNIDPIFFISQSIHETNWGTSSLAKGITITEIADESKPIKNSSGTIIDYERIQLDEPVTVYNLFGIGARDHAPRLLGTTYAYKRGWTTVEDAIFGAAEFVSSNYINSTKYQQNTPFKIKYNHISANQWHQYATTPWYAYEIGKYMHRFAYLYDAGQEFLLDIPVYR